MLKEGKAPAVVLGVRVGVSVMPSKLIELPVRKGRKRHSSNKRVLIVGGAGFLGSHLCERLINEDCHVVCLDNFQTGNLANLASIERSGRLTVIEHDIVNPLPKLWHVDEIYNLACPASPPHYQRDPIHTLKTSVFGALHLLEKARESNAKVFHASTSEIYGDPNVHPQPESYFGNVNTIGPRACYDEGKRCAETLFFDYARRYGTDIRVARIFNTYGPRMQPDDGRVVSNFIVQALQGKDITIYGDGSQTRSFCYVDDLIEGFVRLMNSSLRSPVNLGNPGEFTVRELAMIVLKMTSSQSDVVTMPLPSDDPKVRRPDISLARAELGWEPKIALRDGLSKTISYFDDLLTENSASFRSDITLAL